MYNENTSILNSDANTKFTGSKFDTAIYISNDIYQESITATELYDIRENSIGTYEQKYKDHLYCPECRVAKLSHYYGEYQIPHFRKIPSSNHADWCSSYKPLLPAGTAKAYLKHNDQMGKKDCYKDKDIKNRLKKVLGMLFNNKMYQTNPLVITDSELRKCSIHNKSTAKGNKSYSLPRKLVTNISKDEDINSYKIFYDKIYIRWKVYYSNRTDKNNRFILLYRHYSDNEFKGLCCRLSISENVYKHLEENYKHNQLCLIAFASELTLHKSQDKTYINSSIPHSDYLEIITIKDLTDEST